MLKLPLIFGLLCALALVGYQHREALSAGLKPAFQQLAEAKPTPPPPGAPAARKCVDAAGRVLYTTDAACPPGQREHRVDGGAVTVLRLPAAPPAMRGSAAAGLAAPGTASAPLPLDRIDQATR